MGRTRSRGFFLKRGCVPPGEGRPAAAAGVSREEDTVSEACRVAAMRSLVVSLCISCVSFVLTASFCPSVSLGGKSHHPHFTEREAGVESLNNVPKPHGS